ncbi:hypothetical protein JCM5296_007014 [Sporobolomyces johnsonii]
MVDSRTALMLKYAPMTPDDFMAAHFEALAKREREEVQRVVDEEHISKRRRTSPAVETEPAAFDPASSSRRQRYSPADFQYPEAAPKDVEEFPALQQRNFYSIQNHYATSKHYDLRVHLDGELVSWAIPNGLNLHEHVDHPRCWPQTDNHPLSDALYEGCRRVGTKGVWDIGSYSIFPTRGEEAERKRRLGEAFADGETTDEDDEAPQAQDEHQEDLFRDALHHASFQPTPAVPGRPGLPTKRDEGKKRSFAIELNGERYRNLRISLERKSTDFKITHRGTEKAHRVPEWRTFLYPAKSDTPLPATESRSLLTNRTMEEIAVDCCVRDLDDDGETTSDDDGSGDADVPEGKEGRSGRLERGREAKAGDGSSSSRTSAGRVLA